MMRILKSPEFAKRAGKLGISDAALLKAAQEIESGKIDAHLGKHLIKQRVARTGGGKSGGYRTVIVHIIGDRALFIHAFPKNEKADLEAHELEQYRDLAKLVALLPFEQLLEAEWIEIGYGGYP
jgi:hypothetical protein